MCCDVVRTNNIATLHNVTTRRYVATLHNVASSRNVTLALSCILASSRNVTKVDRKTDDVMHLQSINISQVDT